MIEQGTRPEIRPAMRKDSLKKRYFAKLGVRLFNFLLGFATVGIVPRVLGPGQYGNFGFLTAFFASTVKFLNMGTGTALYMKLSARPEERKLIAFYLLYIAAMAAMVAAGVAGCFALRVQDLVWPGQNAAFVAAAALLALMNFSSSFIQQINDAFGLTVRSEINFAFQSLFSTALILALYFTGHLTLSTYFLAQYLLSAFIMAAGWRILRKHGINPFGDFGLAKREIAAYAREFYAYSHPLFMHALVVFAVAMGDRWLLQHFAGSTEQGFYNLAVKVGSMLFLFTSSISVLFTREMSVNFAKGDRERMRTLFSRYIPLFFFIGAYFSAFILCNAAMVGAMIGGPAFRGATAVIAVMAMYPVYQTYGQLSGSLFLATDQTRTFRNIGAGLEIMGLGASFLLIAPHALAGQGMGALGLGVKMIAIQFVVVTVQLAHNARYLDLPIGRFLGHQAAALGSLGCLAWASSHVASVALANALGRFLLSGCLYSAAVLALALAFPRITAMEPGELKKHFEKAIMSFHSKFLRRKYAP